MKWKGVDCIYLAQDGDLVAWYFENDNEISGSIKGGEFLD
jgi:hypothetical protein